MNTGPQHPLVAQLRRRMLLAIGRGSEPLPSATAYALLPKLAARFVAGDTLADESGLAFLAALNADPALAETFALLVEATAATGAAQPSPGLARRLATIPERVPDVPPRVPPGRAVAIARALEAWRSGGAAALVSVLRSPAKEGALGVATADGGALLVVRETSALYDAHPPPALQFVVSDSAGAAVEVSLAMTEPGGERSRSLAVLLRDPCTGLAPATPWRVLARLGRRLLPGDYVAPGEWALAYPLTEDEFARLTITIRPPAAN